MKKFLEENEPLIAVADAISRGEIGHNNPPDPIDEALEPFADILGEAENWLDGELVTNEEQMLAVDDLIKGLRKAGTTLDKAKKSSTAPLHDAWKAEIARWKPTEDDIKRMRDGLVSIVAPFKKELADKKEAEKRAAYEAARKAEREAEEAAAKAAAGDIEAQRDADEIKKKAVDAKKEASAANKDTVKGMRKVTRYEITDHRALLHWIAQNDKPELTAFIEEWARKNHKTKSAADGLRVWDEREAF